MEPMPNSNERSIQIIGSHDQIVSCTQHFLQEISKVIVYYYHPGTYRRLFTPSLSPFLSLSLSLSLFLFPLPPFPFSLSSLSLSLSLSLSPSRQKEPREPIFLYEPGAPGFNEYSPRGRGGGSSGRGRGWGGGGSGGQVCTLSQ